MGEKVWIIWTGAYLVSNRKGCTWIISNIWLWMWFLGFQRRSFCNLLCWSDSSLYIFLIENQPLFVQHVVEKNSWSPSMYLKSTVKSSSSIFIPVLPIPPTTILHSSCFPGLNTFMPFCFCFTLSLVAWIGMWCFIHTGALWKPSSGWGLTEIYALQLLLLFRNIKTL